ncbi:MAG: hypothetical protein ABF242_00445 [Flavobacteriales bacterium]
MTKIFKTVAVATIALFMINPNSTKAQAYDEGIGFVSLGYGFPNLNKLLNDFAESLDSDVKSTGFGPMHLRFDYGLSETYSIGASVNFSNSGSKWDYETFDGNNNPVVYAESFSRTSINFLVRLNKHFLDNDRFDLYSGVGIGYNYVSIKSESEDPNFVEDDFIDDFANIFPIGFESTIGLRFLFTENLGGYVEAGWSKSLVQFGVVYSFQE